MTCDKFIEDIITESVKEPLNLFLSYAHRESLICRLFAGSLKVRGHSIWFDELNIPHGSDWRTEILKGIERSNGVLSMISKDAVMPGGVCLDELGIAVGVRGGNIRTVLLESNVEIPPALMFRQWLDCSRWQEFKADSQSEEDLLVNPTFKTWFKEKANLLIEMIETQENREFEGQVTAIRKALPLVYMATSKQIYLLNEFHVERTWLRERIDGWLDDPQGESICVIYGDPGIGKSAFAAHYAHYHGRVAAAVFCERGRSNLNRPEAVIQTLSYLLACRITDYREYLSAFLIDKEPIRSLSADELFEVLLATPLNSLIRGNRVVECILVDGIDETGDSEQNAMASILAKFAKRLPGWLRILVLSRDMAAVKKWFGCAIHINLRRDAQENREDFKLFVSESLKNVIADSTLREKTIETIASRSDSVFLYGKMAVNALRKGIITADQADIFPSGLDEIFLRWFEWSFADVSSYNHKVRPVLNLMLASPEPIPEEEILNALEWRRRQLGEFKRLLQVHLCEGENVFGKAVLSLNHSFFCEWLKSPSASEYRVYQDDCILDMAEFFDSILSDDDPEITEYEALFIIPIMKQAAGLSRRMRRAYNASVHNAALMKRQEDLGKDCLQWMRLALSEQYLRYALIIANARVINEDSVENRKHLVICKNRLAQNYQVFGREKEACQLNQEAMAIAKQNLLERGLPEDMRRAAVSFIMVADDNPDDSSIEYYCEAKELLEKASELDPLDHKTARNLAIACSRVGESFLRQGALKEAVSSYQQDIRISRQLAIQTGTPEARRDLSVSYRRMAMICNICGLHQQAEKYYRMALLIMDHLVQERGQPDDVRGLVVLLNEKGLYETTDKDADSTELLESYQRARSMSRKLAEEYGLAKDRNLEANSLVNIGRVLSQAGDTEAAAKQWKEALAIYDTADSEKVVYLRKLMDSFGVH